LQFVNPGHVFFATYFLTDNEDNPLLSHAHSAFRYTQARMLDFGTSTGWQSEYIGDWNHPRGQVMVKYTAR
jgi:hypothetical protein